MDWGYFVSSRSVSVPGDGSDTTSSLMTVVVNVLVGHEVRAPTHEAYVVM